MDEPGVAGALGDSEWGVAHSQARVAALGGVLGRAAPVLGKKQSQVSFRVIKIVGVHRSQEFVSFDPDVKLINEVIKERLSANAVKKGVATHANTIKVTAPRLD
jgi:hypothetical protein